MEWKSKETFEPSVAAAVRTRLFKRFVEKLCIRHLASLLSHYHVQHIISGKNSRLEPQKDIRVGLDTR